MKYYVYKLTLNDGSTYVGSHIEKKENDGYSNSSRYLKRHPELKIINREILFYLPTVEQMSIMETISIISDKCNSEKNINGNYGNWLYNFHCHLDSPWNKNLKMSEEFCKKVSEAEREPIICIETNEYFSHTGKVMHAAEVINGKRESVNGKHYRKFLKEDENEEIRLKNNLEQLKKFYKDKKFILNKDKNIAYYCAENVIKQDHIAKKTLDKFLLAKEKYSYVDVFFLLENNISIPTKTSYKKENLNKKIICVETNEIFNSVNDALKKYKGHITSCLRGRRKTAAGYHWEYTD